MRLSLPALIIALPFVSAVVLASIPSWRMGAWINAAAATLLFLLTCLLPWYPREQSLPATHLVLLTGFVAMTTAWFGFRYIDTALAQQSIDRLRARIYHVAHQTFVGALLCALLSDSPVLTWLMLVAAVAVGVIFTGLPRAVAAPAAAWRMLLHCGVGLMLALFGLLALDLAAVPNGGPLHWSAIAPPAAHFHVAALDLACIFVVLGCGTLAGLVPLHSWLGDAAADGFAPGAIMLGALMPNVPLLIILRVGSAAATSAGSVLLLGLGLASLLLAAWGFLSRPDARRVVAFSGMAQVGMIVFAFGLGTPSTIFVGLLHMTLLTLARASVLQCQCLAPTRASRWTCAVAVAMLASLPFLALLLIGRATFDFAPWLMLPLGGGVFLITGAMVGQLPALVSPAGMPARGDKLVQTLLMVPIWLQLAIAALLALAMPGPVIEWFHALAKSS